MREVNDELLGGVAGEEVEVGVGIGAGESPSASGSAAT